MAKKIYTNEKIIEKLNELYPEKLVTGISKNHKTFYNNIQLRARELNLSNKEYFSSIGFDTTVPKQVIVKKEKGNKVKCNRCGNFLPENHSKKSCPECIESRAKEGRLVREQRRKANLCTRCGSPLNEGEEHLKCEACRNYINDNVQKLRKDRAKKNLCIACGTPLPKGSSHAMCEACNQKSNMYNKSNETGEPYDQLVYTNEVITEKLLEVYPNKKVLSLQKEQSTLYHAIYRRAKSEDLSVKLFVEKLGFNYITSKIDNVKTCSIEGCNNKHYAKGFCYKHYNKFVRV